jgi:hypothetical protein
MPRASEDEFRIVSASGMLGSGFLESSFERALSLKPHAIGCDSGSSDPGPAYLGSGKMSFPAASMKRDLRLIVLGARKLGVPALIGSCGMAGGEPHLQEVFGLLREIVREEGLNLKVALIHAEQDKDYLKAKLREGKIKPLGNAPVFDEAVIDRSERIVGVIGAEPFQKAVERGADVVLAGRASDTAIFASLPVMQGFPEGPAWHAAKILECGSASAKMRKTPDSMFAWIRRDHFDVMAMDPDLECSPQSIASHSLYENADPFEIVENSGVIDLKPAVYTAIDDKKVRVGNSGFRHAPVYTVKLEGAELAGYQAVTVGSIRDPYMIRVYDDWLVRLKERMAVRVDMVYGTSLSDADFTIHYKTYGRDGTMGPLEFVKNAEPHELCLICEVTAKTQDLANAISEIYHHQALHLPIPKWHGLISGVAFPYSPSYFERGPVYRFNIHHVVEPADPFEMFPIEIVELA